MRKNYKKFWTPSRKRWSESAPYLDRWIPIKGALNPPVRRLYTPTSETWLHHCWKL